MLRYNFTPGEVFALQKTKSMTMETTVGAQRTVEHSKVTLVFEFWVESVDAEGNTRIKATIPWYRVENQNKNTGQYREIDSSGDGKYEKALNILFQMPLFLVIDSRGDILEIENFDENIDRFYSEIEAQKLNLEERQVMDAMVQAAYGEKDNIRVSLLGKYFPIYPEQSVEVGDSWSKRTRLDLENVAIDNIERYTLKDLDLPGGKATIAYEESMDRIHNKTDTQVLEIPTQSAGGILETFLYTGLPNTFDYSVDYVMKLYALEEGQKRMALSRSVANTYEISQKQPGTVRPARNKLFQRHGDSFIPGQYYIPSKHPLDNFEQ